MPHPPEDRSPSTKPVSGDETVLLPGGQPFDGQPHKYAPQPPAPQQYAPQQYAPQPPAPQQYAPQQYAPQQYAPQPYAGPGQHQHPYAQHPSAGQQGHGQYGQPPGATAPTSKKRPVGGAAKAIAGLLLLTALLVGIGSVTEWVDAGIVTKNGLEGDGVLTIVFAGIVAVFAVLRLFGRLPTTAAIIGLVFGLLTTLIGFIDVADVRDAGFDVGFGLWLTFAGGIAMTLVSLAALVKRR